MEVFFYETIFLEAHIDILVIFLNDLLTKMSLFFCEYHPFFQDNAIVQGPYPFWGSIGIILTTNITSRILIA